MSSEAATIVDAAARRDALAAQVFGAILGSLDAQVMYIGERLGLYRALADGGPATAPELASRAGIDPRYAREWLEHQAVGGVLDVDDVDAAADDRRYTLPAGHEAVLVDPDSVALLAPLTRFVVGTAQRMPEILAAYRTGAGIDWADYGADVIEAQEATNRPHFRQYVGAWIDDLPDIATRLRAGTGRVADVACGTGWSSIAIAQAFPGIAVDGIDIDPGSIERAKAHAAAEGVSDRVRFLTADAAAADGAGQYDLVTIFEALHDMSRPAEVLAAAARLLAPGGAVLVADERVAERFTAPGDEAERLFYGYSVVGCLVNGRFDQPSVATGTVLRPSGVEAIAREAGFTGFTMLPTDHENFRFYRLDP
jgi:2-polyprenyl-3-methyl-5-hydroxy-6-metoxy-1,4-benzoquinol methylase